MVGRVYEVEYYHPASCDSWIGLVVCVHFTGAWRLLALSDPLDEFTNHGLVTITDAYLNGKSSRRIA